MTIHKENIYLEIKYKLTSRFYDILDFPWELQYRKWRPKIIGDMRGKVLEAGVGTGRNLKYYHPDVELTGIDLSQYMLRIAKKRALRAHCKIELFHEDATLMQKLPSNNFDWVISTFMCCVMPDPLQPLAIQQIARTLKNGGRFRLVEIIYSKNQKLKRRQALLAPFVEKIYGARFDRNTLSYIADSDKLKITSTSFLKDDTYLLIEGKKYIHENNINTLL